MRSRPMRAMLLALASIGVCLAGPRSVYAQVLVLAERDLQFGQLMPGVPTTIPAADLTRSAQLRIDGRGTYQVSFQLPSALTAPGGAQIPLAFGALDGLLTIRHKLTQFDPRTTLTFKVNPADQEAVINLGGRAQPAPTQVAGFYSATIVMMVVQTGT